MEQIHQTERLAPLNPQVKTPSVEIGAGKVLEFDNLGIMGGYRLPRMSIAPSLWYWA